MKKEYKCYRGLETEECCRSKVEEAVKHRTYIIMLIMSVALMIIALTVKTADNEEFVGQISFASTITSIILSVIAIWMSITGERSTNEIKDRVEAAADSLTKTTDASRKLSEQLENMLDGQSKKYDILLEKMQNNIENSEGIKETLSKVTEAFGKVSTAQEFSEKSTKSVDILSNVIDHIYSENLTRVLLDTVDFVMKYTPVPVDEVAQFVRDKGGLNEQMVGFIVGTVYVCAKNGLLLDQDEYIEMKENVLERLKKKGNCDNKENAD